MAPISITSTKRSYLNRRDASRGVGRTSVYPIFDRYFPGVPPCVGREGENKKVPQPEMAPGTLPLTGRFGSRHDELITREERRRGRGSPASAVGERRR